MSLLQRVSARLIAPLAILAAIAVGAAALALADSRLAERHGGPCRRRCSCATARSGATSSTHAAARCTCSRRIAAVAAPATAAVLRLAAPRRHGHVTRGAGVSAARLGPVQRRDGGRQVTYGGHPLYFYAGDSRPGTGAGLRVRCERTCSQPAAGTSSGTTAMKPLAVAALAAGLVAASPTAAQQPADA